MPHNIILQVENIRRHLLQGGHELHILNGISFAVKVGNWLALTGPSGSGKPTLLGILAGIDRPSGGKVSVEGTEISALPEGRLARLRNEKIGVVFQSFHLIPTMTALKNMEAPLYIHPQQRRANHAGRNAQQTKGDRPDIQTGGQQFVL
jgi:putative ABC transport system ATP-binding protein